MSDIELDPIYEEALKLTERIQPNPEGLTSYIPQGKADQTIIKQNNTLIILLLEINKKLDKIIKEKEIKTEIPKVDDLIEQLKRVEITPQKDRIKIRKPQKWTFFQVGETKKDQE